MSLRVEEGDNELRGSGQKLSQRRSIAIQAAKPADETIQSKERPLLLEDGRIVQSLRAIVSRFSMDPTSRQDMLQGCKLCLWIGESKDPGRKVMWYWQRDRFDSQAWLVM